MQEAVVVLDVLRERGRKGLPFTQLYRQMFNKEGYSEPFGNVSITLPSKRLSN
jgi:hypothetical protein